LASKFQYEQLLKLTQPSADEKSVWLKTFL
jgi:hypothetical protein